MIAFALIAAVIFLGFVSLVFSGISLSVAYFLAKEPLRSRKLILAFWMPFLAVYVFSGICFWGNAIVANSIGTDIGVGDWFFVNISRNYSLYFVDTTEYGGHIGSSEGGFPLVSDIVEICERGNVIFGKSENGTFFSFNVETEKPEIYANESALIAAIPEAENAELVPAGNFYRQKAGQLYGAWHYVILTLSAGLTAAVVTALCRITLKTATTNLQS